MRNFVSPCTFTIASNRYFKQNESTEKETSFFDIETWAKLAENCGQLGHKGRGVRVVGRLKQNRWNDADGQSRSKITIVGEHGGSLREPQFRPDVKRDAEAQPQVEYEPEQACEEVGYDVPF